MNEKEWLEKGDKAERSLREAMALRMSLEEFNKWSRVGEGKFVVAGESPQEKPRRVV